MKKNHTIFIRDSFLHSFFFNQKNTMGSEAGSVMVDGIPFPAEITTNKPLPLLAHGITDMEIHFLQIKFTAIGVYLDPQILSLLQNWKSQNPPNLTQHDHFFHAIIAAPVEKVIRVVVIKEIKGSQYGDQLETAVRDRLVEDGKFEDAEEEALDKIAAFFQTKYFKKDSTLTFYFPNISTVQIGFTTEGKEETKMEVKNENVVEMIQKWYLGGSKAVSPTVISSLATTLSIELSK